MSSFSPAKHARVDCQLPPVLFLRRPRIGFRGMTARTTNHSTLGCSTEYCQTPDIRYTNVVAMNRWLSAFAILSSENIVSVPRPLTLLEQIASEAVVLL